MPKGPQFDALGRVGCPAGRHNLLQAPGKDELILGKLKGAHGNVGWEQKFTSPPVWLTEQTPPHSTGGPVPRRGWHANAGRLCWSGGGDLGDTPSKNPWTVRASEGGPGIRWQKTGWLSDEGSRREKGLPVGEKPEQRP